MRISDWSSDVCSSDLLAVEIHRIVAPFPRRDHAAIKIEDAGQFVPVETRLVRRRARVMRPWGHLPHQALFRLPLRRGASSLAAVSASRSASSAARRVGKACVSTCWSGLYPYHKKKN